MAGDDLGGDGGLRVEAEGVAETADWFTPRTYVGAYAGVDAEDHPFRLVERDGGLWVQSAGQPMRLWPVVDTPHRFRGLHGWVSFTVEEGRARSVSYEIDDGLPMEAVRVQ